MAANIDDKNSQNIQKSRDNFSKVFPIFSEALCGLSKDYPPAVNVFIAILAISNDKGISLFSQADLSKLTGLNRRTVKHALLVIAKDEYGAASNLRGKSINAMVINPNLIYKYNRNEAKKPLTQLFHFPNGMDIMRKKHAKTFYLIKNSRKKEIKKRFLNNITPRDLACSRVDHTGQIIHKAVYGHISHASLHNVKANFLFYAHKINLSRREKAVTRYFIRRINSTTYSLQTGDKGLYEMMRKDFLHIGYSTVVNTIRDLKNNGLIYKSIVTDGKHKYSAFTINPKIVKISNHKKLTYHHKLNNKFNSLFQKKI